MHSTGSNVEPFEAETPSAAHHGKNLSETERWVSMIGGGALIAYGLSKRSLGGLLVAGLGGALLQRGASAHCMVYDRMGISTRVPGGTELQIEDSITIYRPLEEVFEFYRDFENLPRFTKHLDSVTNLGHGRSHWVMNLPGGKKLEWDAQIVEERVTEVLRWRSLDGADFAHHGQVRFERASGDRGTEVHVSWRYQPPGKGIGAMVGKLAEVFTHGTLRGELQRMKQILETGEIATTEGQPSGREALPQDRGHFVEERTTSRDEDIIIEPVHGDDPPTLH